jgi:superoxide dismutase, Cu-Zn family
MNWNIVCAGCAAAVLVVGCASQSSTPAAKAAARVKAPEAFALLEPTHGNLTNGTVRFTQEGDRLLVVAKVHNLPPNTEHGFHLHEKGDCSSGDGMSTGGHFNPDGHPHGPQNAPHHDGDMPMLKANANGVAEAAFVLQGVTVSAGAHSVVGKGLIVHKDPDDYTTQPTGNAGARVACGVVVQR